MATATAPPPTDLPKRKISNASANGIPLLYHYQPCKEDRLTDFLKTKRAWCSVIANVNDPWDCTMAFKIDDDHTASRTISQLKSIARPSKHGPEADAAMDFELTNNPAMLLAVTRAIAEQAHKDASDMRRIYCLTPRIDSTLMWSHYAENHKGICLEFAVKEGNVFGSAFKVIYEEEFISQELYSLAIRTLRCCRSLLRRNVGIMNTNIGFFSECQSRRRCFSFLPLCTS